MSSGTGGQIAVARIGSLYSDVNTLNLWTNFVTESVEHTLEELEEGSITGRRDAPPSHKGIDSAAGDIELEPNPNAIGIFLKGFFGTHVASTVTAATSGGANSGDLAGAPQIFHRFTPRQAAFSERVFLEPHNVGIYRDTGSMFIHKGVIFPSLSFDIQAGQLVKSTVNIMGRKTDRIARGSVASLVSSGGRPWVWDMASVQVSTIGTDSAALAAKDVFEQVTLTFELPHEGVALLDGTKLYGEMQPNDFRRVSIEGTMSFRNQDEYDAFTAYENRRMHITLLNVNSRLILGNPASADASAFQGYYGLRFLLPAVKYLSWSAPIGGPNRLTASFTAKAEYSEAEGIMAAVELVNNTSSAAYTQTY